MIDRIRRAVESGGLIGAGEGVLAAVSGGPDSMAMLECLFHLSKEMGFDLEAAHVDHGLRGASGEDARLVMEQVRARGLAFHLEEVRAAEASRRWKTSVQDAAHRLRMEFLEETRWRRNLDVIALGHHREDQVETVLLHFLRGAGPEGLSGLRPREGRIIRPLIYTDPEQILEFCASRNLPYSMDESNRERKYMRNRIRLDLAPLLRQHYNPGLSQVMIGTADLMAQVADFLNSSAREALESIREGGGSNALFLDPEGFFRLHPAVRMSVIRECYGRLSGTRRDLDLDHVKMTANLWERGEPGSRLHLPRGIRAWVSGRGLAMGSRESMAESLGRGAGRYRYRLEVPGRAAVEEAGLLVEADPSSMEEFRRHMEGSKACPGPGSRAPGGDFPFLAREVYIDYNKVDLPLTVRNRRDGDWFRPLGLGGRKKIKDFFISNRVPPSLRDRIPLVLAGDRVVWVAGMRLDEDFKIGRETTSVVRLRVSEIRRV